LPINTNPSGIAGVFLLFFADSNPFWQYRIYVTDDQEDDDNAYNNDHCGKERIAYVHFFFLKPFMKAFVSFPF
jgi:hypothetical protein